MRVGAFEIDEPVPELRDPHALLMLSPWIDVSGVGSATLRLLEANLGATELGRLRRPGAFYDFTRYRPMMYLVEGRRQITIPNTSISYARRHEGSDLLFLHCLEPHTLGETYVESILRVLEKLNVKRCCLLGSMYDSVPHTRPLIVTGTASETETEGELRRLNVNRSGYQGPTTINVLLLEQAPKRGIETLTLIVHLPHYAQLEEDYSGQHALLIPLCHLYNFPIDLGEVKRRGEEQYRKISTAVERNPQVKQILKAIEASYDAKAEEPRETEGMPHLSPEIERFLREIDQAFD